MRREVDLVDDEKVRPGDTGSPLGRDLVARRDVDHVNREIGQFGRESSGEIVAAGFDQHQIETWKFRPHIGDRGEVHRGVLADRGMRAAAGLDAGDAIRRQRSRAHQEFRIPFGVDVVGDRGDVVAAGPSARFFPIRRDLRCRREADRSSWAYQRFPSVSSSLRKQGPIATGARCERRCLPARPNDGPRRMGPRVRGDDTLVCERITSIMTETTSYIASRAACWRGRRENWRCRDRRLRLPARASPLRRPPAPAVPARAGNRSVPEE